MRRTAFSFLLIIILTTFCTSRRSQYGVVLADIDRLTEVNADSARRLLAGLSDEMNDAPAEVQAYYQLLLVKADDKAHVRHTSDSLINTVATYFKKNPQSGHLPEAYYYVGRVNSDLQNGERASSSSKKHSWKTALTCLFISRAASTHRLATSICAIASMRKQSTCSSLPISIVSKRVTLWA